MKRLAVVDTHVHLWNLAHPTLTWNWVDTDDDHPVLGNIDAVKTRAYEMADLWAEARFADVEAFVHVQAALGSKDPVDETRWLTAMAHPRLAAIVGHVDLASPNADRTLDEHSESPLFRGVRDFAVEPYLAAGVTDARMEESLDLLAWRGLVLDLDCEQQNMPAARALAQRHPELTIVLEHIGFPRSRDEEYLRAWRDRVRELAGAPNVMCKISGVGMTDPGFTRASLAPWIEHCLDTFGADRCMLGSNWPLDRIRSSYDAVFDILRDFVGELSSDEQAKVLSANARRVYLDRP